MSTHRSISKKARRYLEHEWSNGIGPKASGQAYNILTKTRYSQVHAKGYRSDLAEAVFGQRSISKAELTRAYDRWRVKARRDRAKGIPSTEAEQKYGEGGRDARRAAKQSEYISRLSEAEERAARGLTTPVPNPDRARDAGLLYSLTGDERYLDKFEGS